MKNILITCGPTNEYIDKVMKITNMSNGKLGLQLATSFCEDDEQYSVTLIGNKALKNSSLASKFEDFVRIRFVEAETTQDMLNALHLLSKSPDWIPDVIIHSSAVGDYKPAYIFRLEDMADEIWNRINTGMPVTKANILGVLTNPNCKVNDDSKISSYEPNLTIKLTLTSKIISNLRDWFPSSVILGFKLLEGVEKEHLYEVAQKLCQKNNVDYVLANDLTDLKDGKLTRYLCDKNGFSGMELEGSDGIFNFVKTHLIGK